MLRFILALVIVTALLGQTDAQPSSGSFLLIRGAFVIIGKQPDGDSVRFIPDQPALLKKLKRSSRIRISSDGSIQLRFEGIDAPELHYENLEQPYSREPRDVLLARMGFSSIEFTPKGLQVRSSLPTQIRGAILSEAAEGNGRPISYVFLEPDAPKAADGSRLDPDPITLKRSLNTWLLETGNAYLTVYSSQPESHRMIFRNLVLRARTLKLGVWARDATNDFDLSTLESVTEQQLILPKLFRRAVVYFQARAQGFKGSLVDWFTANPGRDDGVLVGSRRTTLSKLLEPLDPTPKAGQPPRTPRPRPQHNPTGSQPRLHSPPARLHGQGLRSRAFARARR